MMKMLPECAMHKTNENYKSQDPGNRLIYLFYFSIDYTRRSVKAICLVAKLRYINLKEGSGCWKKDRNEQQRDLVSFCEGCRNAIMFKK